MGLADFANLKVNKETLYVAEDFGMKDYANEFIDIIRQDDSWSRKTEGLHYTNLDAHHTEWRMHLTHKCFKILSERVEDYITEKSHGIGIKLETKEVWGGIYGQGESAAPHSHQPYIWSWCYYVKAPEGCSPIIFPRHQLDEKGKDEIIQPKDDMLVVFPGSKVHKVPKSEIKEERVMIAGNTSY